MKEILSKFYSAFRRATDGKETLSHMIWWWGVFGYLISYFICDSIVKSVDFRFVDVAVSVVVVVYFIWHIYALYKCAPKKPKLTPEEKEKIKQDRMMNIGRSAVRKLLLREPITRWDPVFMTAVIDALCITHFFGYIFK